MKKFLLFVSLFLALQGVLLAQCFAPLACPSSPVVCDTTANNFQLWNDSLFYDQTISSHNLADAPVHLSMQIVDTCSIGTLNVYYVLRMDLNGDGVFETAVSSKALPGTDVVYYGNAANPNFSGGEARHYDNRPVPPEEKYLFALEQTQVGQLTTVRVRWATAAAPTTYIDPQLPYGLYRIDWYFEHSSPMSFDAAHCNYLFTVKDCQAPVVSCKANQVVNLPPTQFIQLTATEMLQATADNYTPNPPVAIRRAGQGTGFPVDGNGNAITKVPFTCADLGLQTVEVWAKDLADNAGFCTAQVLVQDTVGYCNPTPVTLCAIHHCDMQPLNEVTFEINGSSNSVPPFTIFSLPDSGSCLTVSPNAFPIASNAKVGPVKDDHPLDGVTTLDLVLITRDLLGIQPLGSPYELIAANADNNSLITAFDVAEIRKLILGVYQEYPNNTSWRFVDSSFVFPNPLDPYQTVFPESISYMPSPPSLYRGFYGMKIGDVNCTALQPMTPPDMLEAITMPNLDLQTNDVVEVPVQFLQARDYYGYQFGLQFDPALVQVEAVIPVVGTPANFHLINNTVNVSLSTPLPATYLPDEPLFRLRIKALAPVHIEDAFTMATGNLRPEAYPGLPNDSLVGLQLLYQTVATKEPDAAAGIFSPQPNPTTAGVRIPLRLEQAQDVQVELLDVTGRLLYQQQQSGRVGAQWLDIPATAFAQAGVYVWRVRIGPASRSGKIVRQ